MVKGVSARDAALGKMIQVTSASAVVKTLLGLVKSGNTLEIPSSWKSGHGVLEKKAVDH